jgi:DNA-binding CsgD family transcriptional regulator
MQLPAPPPSTTPAGGTHVLEVYRYAARKGAIDTVDVVAGDLGIGEQEVDLAVRYLVESHLLRRDASCGNRLVPVDPEIAAASLVSRVEREIYQRREQIDQIRERITAFCQDLPGADRESPSFLSVDYLVGAMEVRGFLKMASDACRDEVLVLLSSNDEGGEWNLLASAYLPLLGKGITVRIICQHRNRADLATRMNLKRLIDAGAAVRTVSYVPRAAAVFDRSLAVLFGPSGEQPGVIRVTNYSVVRFLLDLFSHSWDAATPLDGAEAGYAGAADDLQRTIASLMAEGYTDEVIARKLDMSVRTCRRHIAALLRDLGSISRFQAGVRAARRYFAAGAR